PVLSNNAGVFRFRYERTDEAGTSTPRRCATAPRISSTLASRVIWPRKPKIASLTSPGLRRGALTWLPPTDVGTSFVRPYRTPCACQRLAWACRRVSPKAPTIRVGYELVRRRAEQGGRSAYCSTR